MLAGTRNLQGALLELDTKTHRVEIVYSPPSLVSHYGVFGRLIVRKFWAWPLLSLFTHCQRFGWKLCIPCGVSGMLWQTLQRMGRTKEVHFSKRGCILGFSLVSTRDYFSGVILLRSGLSYTHHIDHLDMLQRGHDPLLCLHLLYFPWG